jgi:hypothetical protein
MKIAITMEKQNRLKALLAGTCDKDAVRDRRVKD